MKTSFFALCLGVIGSITLPAQEFLLVSFDLAGMPVEAPPADAELRIEAEEYRTGHVHWAVYASGRKIGYLPARFRTQFQELMRDRARVTLRVKQIAEIQRPGKFMKVGLWVMPRFPDEEFPCFELPEDPPYEWALTLEY
jgi:hypothetical protein